MTWATTRIDRVATVNARIGWKALTASEYQPDGYVFLATPNIRSESIDFEDVNYISKDRYEESPELKLQPGDVLLAKDGSTLGITNIVRELPRLATVNGSIAVLRAFGVEPRFLRYSVASSTTQQLIQSIKGGMGVPHLFQWDIKRLPIALPPPDEQRRIADFLDAETTRIDQLHMARARQLEVLEELRASRISAVVPSESQVPFVRLGYVAVVQSGVTVDGSRDPGVESVTLPYLRVANVQNGYVDLESVTEITVPRLVARSATLRRGDVLMTEGGDLDKLGRGTVWLEDIKNCLHQNHIFAVRPDQRQLVPEYLALLTRTSYARAYFERTGTKTTNLASTSSSKIRDFRIPLTDVAVQVRVCGEIEGWLRGVAKVQTILVQQLSLLADRRQALITAAVTRGISV